VSQVPGGLYANSTWILNKKISEHKAKKLNKCMKEIRKNREKCDRMVNRLSEMEKEREKKRGKRKRRK